MKTSLLESLIVGIVSIASTIMVIQLVVPDSGELRALVLEWRTLLAHYISFFLLFMLWYNHAKEFSRVESVKPDIVLFNAIWLIFLALIPFATGWLERFPNDTAPEALFVLLFSLCIIINSFIIKSLEREYPDVTFSTRLSILERFPIYIALVIAFINSFFFPFVNLFILFALTVYMIFLILKHRNDDVVLF